MDAFGFREDKLRSERKWAGHLLADIQAYTSTHTYPPTVRKSYNCKIAWIPVIFGDPYSQISLSHHYLSCWKNNLIFHSVFTHAHHLCGVLCFCILYPAASAGSILSPPPPPPPNSITHNFFVTAPSFTHMALSHTTLSPTMYVT